MKNRARPNWTENPPWLTGRGSRSRKTMTEKTARVRNCRFR